MTQTCTNPNACHALAQLELAVHIIEPAISAVPSKIIGKIGENFKRCRLRVLVTVEVGVEDREASIDRLEFEL